MAKFRARAVPHKTLQGAMVEVSGVDSDFKGVIEFRRCDGRELAGDFAVQLVRGLRAIEEEEAKQLRK